MRTNKNFVILTICKNVYRKVSGYNITFKRINDIVKGAKYNFIDHNC